MKLKKNFYFIFSLISSILVTYLLHFSGALSYLENKSYDFRMRMTADCTEIDRNIIFIGIDQESLNQTQKNNKWGWPWPRKAYAELTDFLTAAGVSSINYDILFSEPSIYGEEDDLTFVEACRKSEKVFQVAYKEQYPIPELAEVCNIASCVSEPDSDGVIRSVVPFYKQNWDEKELPLLGAAAFVQNKSEIQNVKDFSQEKKYFLRYKGSVDRYIHYNAWEVLSGQIDKECFEGADVFVFLYAPGLFDICSTSISQDYPGCGVHITFLDNARTNNFIDFSSETVNLLVIFLTAFLGSICFSLKFESQQKKYLFLTLIFVFVPLSFLALNITIFAFNYYLVLLAPLFAFFISFFAELVLNYALEDKNKRFIQSAFSQYLSPAVIKQLIDNPEKLKLGGEEKTLTIFFSDVQSFTSLSEKLSPAKLTEVLNIYLTGMTNIILKNGGTIDKYEGDAIIAFWNAPVSSDLHAFQAVKAALECQKFIRDNEEYFKKLCGRGMWTRIGLNTGKAIVGNMGSQLRFDYTMLGDSVNLASRLEGANKFLGTYLLCSESLKIEVEKELQQKSESCDENLPEIYWRNLGKICVVGKNTPVRVYEPLSSDDAILCHEELELFSKGLQFYEQGNFSEASDYFKNASEASRTTAESTVCRKYEERCQKLSVQNIQNWNGIWVLDEK